MLINEPKPLWKDPLHLALRLKVRFRVFACSRARAFIVRSYDLYSFEPPHRLTVAGRFLRCSVSFRVFCLLYMETYAAHPPPTVHSSLDLSSHSFHPHHARAHSHSRTHSPFCPFCAQHFSSILLLSIMEGRASTDMAERILFNVDIPALVWLSCPACLAQLVA